MLLGWWRRLRYRDSEPVGRGRRRGKGRGEVRFRPQLTALEDRYLLSVNVGTSFPGLDRKHDGLFPSLNEPPDTIAAAGPTAIVEAVNL
jgi:hypothetical protein